MPKPAIFSPSGTLLHVRFPPLVRNLRVVGLINFPDWVHQHMKTVRTILAITCAFIGQIMRSRKRHYFRPHFGATCPSS